MRKIFEELSRQMALGRDTVLVTVTAQQGSTPRGPGAQMLVGEAGLLAGTVGGGAVEGQCLTLAKELLRKKTSVSRDFLLFPNEKEDIGMICGGGITAYLQFIPAGDPDWQALTQEAKACFAQGKPAWLGLDLTGGPAKLVSEGEGSRPYRRENHFFLPLPLGDRAVIFGGGHIARALVPILATVGFRPVIFETRPEFAAKDRFPQASQVLLGDFENIGATLPLQDQDYAVVITSGHAGDFAVEKQLLTRNLAYVGVVGSRKKTAKVNGWLREAGIGEEAISRIHTPIGLPIGAVTPEEIAVSIAAEMIACRAQRTGISGSHRCPV